LKVGDTHEITRAMMPTINALLVDLIADLRDPAIPFTHDPESRYCNCCVY
jgi:hypothetical protein